jgi:hypothetical protein
MSGLDRRKAAIRQAFIETGATQVLDGLRRPDTAMRRIVRIPGVIHLISSEDPKAKVGQRRNFYNRWSSPDEYNDELAKYLLENAFSPKRREGLFVEQYVDFAEGDRFNELTPQDAIAGLSDRFSQAVAERDEYLELRWHGYPHFAKLGPQLGIDTEPLHRSVGKMLNVLSPVPQSDRMQRGAAFLLQADAKALGLAV